MLFTYYTELGLGEGLAATHALSPSTTKKDEKKRREKGREREGTEGEGGSEVPVYKQE